MGSSVKLERSGNIAIVTLNRPEVLNAVNVESRETLITLLTELNAEAGTRAVVITGAGERAFCSGQDLDETSRYQIADVDTWLTRQHAMYGAVRLTKQRFRALTQSGFDDALEAGKAAQKQAFASGEPQAAMQKFLDARKTKA